MREALVLLLLVSAPLQALADPYDDALAGARLEAARGRFQEAAQALRGPAATWPQDFPLQLARAYYLLRGGAYAAAEAQYRVALALEPGSPEARQGLADAREGRGAPDQLWIALSGGGTTYGGRTARSALFTGALRVDAQLADRWVFGALYRGLGTTSALSGGGRGSGASAAASIQSEGHVWLGLAAPDWQLRLHGAAISRSASTRAGVEQVYGYGGGAAGVSAMLRRGLEWRASAITSWYEDLTTTQLEVTGTLPIGDHLALAAGARSQLAGAGPAGAALASIEWRGPWSLALSGEYGPQRRPVDLSGGVLYDLPDELRWAARLQSSLLLGHQVRLWLGAGLEGWRTPPAAGPPVDYTAARLSTGLSLSF